MTRMAQRRVDLKELWLNNPRPRRVTGGESIHSGHFMISDFEAEAQDDEDELAVPVPEVAEPKAVIPCRRAITSIQTSFCPTDPSKVTCNLLSIETSLTKLFQCMSIAYRQKLTSPKWNRFKGVRLRWKDKIRLNNVIWRCWHMQFVNKQNTLVCQFASPLDVDTHNKPEAIVLEGKYWKRKLHAVTAEYKKWRMFTYNQILGKSGKGHDLLSEFESPDWQVQGCEQMMVDEDYMSLMSDTLFSAISGPFPFPDTRELARSANLADFIQPSLVQLQPSLDEIMDIEPLNDLLCTKLTSVSEEMGGGYGKHGRELPYAQQEASSYPVWYIPPYSQSQQQAAQQQQLFPPPPPPPPTPPQPPAKPKLKHRVPAANSSVNKKLAPTRSSDTSPPSLNQPLQPSVSSQSQNSALLEQLLSTNANNLYNFLESSTDPSNVSKMSPSTPALQSNQSVEVPFLPTPYEQLDNAQLLYQRSKQSNIISNPDLSYGVSPENSCMPPSPASSENSSPAKVSLLSPITPPLSSKGGIINSCPESPAGSQEQLTLSPLNVGSPSSPKSVPAYKEHRRVCHINAEQKRRCNIKNGFDTLHSLIPQLTQNPNAKMSKAAMLQKGADYIVQLRNERSALKQEMESLKQQIESLNSTICNCQSMLPVTGAPISRHRSNRMKDMFRQYVRSRTHENWKFWILSLIFEPLLESFNNSVSTNSLEDLYQTTLQWVDQHCTLIDLRPVVLNALRQLCTTTEVLSDPARLPSEARAAVDKSSKKSSSQSHH